MSYMDRLIACTRHDLSHARRFVVAGRQMGWIRQDFAAQLAPFNEVFEVSPAHVAVLPTLASPEARTAAVDGVLRQLHQAGVIAHWRNEPFPVAATLAETPLMLIDRGAASHFGIRSFGLHVNGVVRRQGEPWMWVGRRAADRIIAPGQYDQLVAGGQPAGLSLADNLLKEGAEEADIPAALMAEAKPVSLISYKLDLPHGLRNDVLFIYDLELPETFTPRNTDGEVEEFQLWPLERVAQVVHDSADFKFNCALVVIDFLLRHGVITPDHADYVALAQGLRS